MKFQFKTAKRGKQRAYFLLIANNGEPVDKSEMYSSAQARKDGADALLKAAGEYWKEALATLIDETAQRVGEEENRQLTAQDMERILLSLNNDDLQAIIDRIPYEKEII